MFLNKKGINLPFEYIIVLITIMVFAVAFLYFQTNKLKPASEQFFDIEACRLSVQRAALPGLGVTSLEELNGCKTQTIPIDEIDPDIVQEVLAKSLYNCWLMFGQGKVDFMKNFERDNVCFRCSKIIFKNDVDGVSKESLNIFIGHNKEYSAMSSSPKFILLDNIKANRPIYSMFVGTKVGKATSFNSFSDFIETVAGTYAVGSGLVFGPNYADNFLSSTLLVSKEKIKDPKVCQEIA